MPLRGSLTSRGGPSPRSAASLMGPPTPHAAPRLIDFSPSLGGPSPRSAHLRCEAPFVPLAAALLLPTCSSPACFSPAALRDPGDVSVERQLSEAQPAQPELA